MRARNPAKRVRKARAAPKPPRDPDEHLSPVAGVAALRRQIASPSDPAKAAGATAMQQLLAKLEADYRRIHGALAPAERSPAQSSPQAKRRAASSHSAPVRRPSPTAHFLRLCRVTKDDVVYDLGCGDGRTLIEVVRRTGARGLGVDADEERIAHARKLAARARVGRRVRFTAAPDVSAVDLDRATVVILEGANVAPVALRRRLLDSLAPGSRILSVAVELPDWRCERSLQVGGQIVRCWVVPARR
jgi:SAM-dependent methyltransferase